MFVYMYAEHKKNPEHKNKVQENIVCFLKSIKKKYGVEMVGQCRLWVARADDSFPPETRHEGCEEAHRKDERGPCAAQGAAAQPNLVFARSRMTSAC